MSIDASSESKDFRNLLESPLTWPEDEGRLFTSGKGWWENAQVTHHPLSRAAIIERGYKRAGDILVGQALKEQSDMNFLVYPIIFCYRHYLELNLKWILMNYGKYAGIGPDTSSHNLRKLWSNCRHVLEHFSFDDQSSRTGIESVEGLVHEFARVDPGSFNFRYTTDTCGEPIALQITDVGLENLREKMGKLDHFFCGWDGYIDFLVSATDY